MDNAEMELSPQSAQEVQKLLRGIGIRSGSVVVGPLNDAGKKALSLLADHISRLQQFKGAAQAQEFRKLYKAEATTTPEQDAEATTSPNLQAPRKWKLEKLTCKSIRGIAPPGEQFEFTFDSKSLLIFGPNGSGKSSLASAVIWVLTGNAPTDSDSPSTTAPLYRLSDNAKACDWDVIRTLPNVISEATSSNDGCFAQVELHDDAGNIIHLRRDLVNGLASSADCVTWQPCKTLDVFGISALDLQLSLTAPGTFGRKSIETAEDTRSLLSMMLGYDDLEGLGELASAVARNRTTLFNSETEGLNSEWTTLRTSLESQIALLTEGSEQKRILSALAAKQPLTSADIIATGTSFSTLIAAAEQALAVVLGISTTAIPPKLADNLTVLLADLEAGTTCVLPTLDSISPTTLVEVTSVEEARAHAVTLKGRFSALLVGIAAKISARYAWWVKETAAGSKASLLLRAASFYDQAADTCPVCEKPITDAVLRNDLLTLSNEDQSVGQELKAFFSDLTDEVESCFGEGLFDAGKSPFINTLQSEWSKFQERLNQMGLATLISPFDEPLRGYLSTSCQIPEWDCPSLFPTGTAPAFVQAAVSFQSALTQAGRALTLLDWSCSSHSSLHEHLKGQFCAVEASSLLGRLTAGKQAAADIRPLAAVRDSLRTLLVKVRGLEELAIETNLLDEMKAPLDELKKLSKYAANEVAITFDGIQEKTISNWKLLYPEQPTGMTPFGLSMKKGKDKSVEGLVSGSDYKAPMHFFANAGWQRAAALSFYFAMLERHPKGLGFFILDDPILSLDDEHRERWAVELLCPSLNTFQIILATHQRQFLLNCGHYFEPEYTIELNPRIRKRAISWLPGNNLIRARANILIDWANTPNMLRQYREYLVLTVEAYSPEPFLAPSLRNSLDNYRNLSLPNPLAHKRNNTKICDILDERAVANVLDPGSHAATQVTVTRAMVESCLDRLTACDRLLREEITRLEDLRAREMRRTVIPSRILPFPTIPATASWSDEVEINVLGGAAARSGHYVVDLAGGMTTIALSGGSAVLVTCDALDPVAKKGQWILLGGDLTDQDHGALAAVATSEGRFLRRVWPDRERWILQSVNPVDPVASLSVPKMSASAKRVIGVIYKPETFLASTSSDEWCPHGRGVLSELRSSNAIHVLGDSLAPIALTGQKVLVDQPLTHVADVPKGALAVVETTSGDVGLVIKRVFLDGNNCVLLSPNPVDAIAPIIVPTEEITRIWPLRGVLFEAQENTA